MNSTTKFHITKKYVFVLMVLVSFYVWGTVNVNASEIIYNNVINCDNMPIDKVKSFYYDQLDFFEQCMYDNMMKADADNKTFNISDDQIAGKSKKMVYNSVYRAYSAFLADNPMKRWKFVRENININNYGSGYTVSLVADEHRSDYETAKAEAEINRIVETVNYDGGEQYMVLVRLWNYLADNMKYYDESDTFTDSSRIDYYNDSALGAILKHRSTSYGYADMLKILCDKLDIPCIIVGAGQRRWNYIEMEDGKWYSFDASDCIFCDYKNGILIGYNSERYNNSTYYSYDSLYMIGSDVFPMISKEQYYAGQYNASRLKYIESDSAFEESDAVFLYKVNRDNSTCTVTGYEGEETGDIIIPSYIDGHKVTEIGNEAFYSTGFDGGIVIPDTVTVIGNFAFRYCDMLNGKLIMSQNIKSIGTHAFSGCSGLTGSIDLPESLEYIYAYAYYDCSGFTGDLIIPDNIKTISSAFHMCEGLDGELYLPDNLPYDAWMVTGNAFKSIRISETNKRYKVHDGVLYSRDGKKLIAYPEGKSGDVVFADGVTEIGAYSFLRFRGTIGDLVIPEGVVSIGDNAFQEAGFLGELTLPQTLQSIGEGAFCVSRFSGDLVIPDSVTLIGQNAFCACDNHKGYHLKLSQNLTTIPDYAFANCFFVGTLEIPDKVKTIGDNAFYWCGFDDVDLNRVTKIGYGSFYRTKQVSTSDMYDPDWDKIVVNYSCVEGNDYVRRFAEENDLSLTLYEGVMDSGDKDSDNNNNQVVENGDVNGGNNTIISNAYDDGNTGTLNEESNGSNVETANKTGIDGKSGTDKKEINGISESNKLKTFTRKKNVYVITGKKSVAFVRPVNDKIKKVKITDTVKIDGKKYKVTKVNDRAFYGCKKLTTVSVGNNVKIIGKQAFANCKNLKSITFGKNIKRLEDGVLAGDIKLMKIMFKSTQITDFGKGTFKKVPRKVNIYIPKKKAKEYVKLIKKAK